MARWSHALMDGDVPKAALDEIGRMLGFARLHPLDMLGRAGLPDRATLKAALEGPGVADVLLDAFAGAGWDGAFAEVRRVRFCGKPHGGDPGDGTALGVHVLAIAVMASGAEMPDRLRESVERCAAMELARAADLHFERRASLAGLLDALRRYAGKPVILRDEGAFDVVAQGA